MVRTPCCEKMGLKKGPWTPEEDRILVSFIHQYGHDNWRALPKQAGLLRCGKSCRLRWINYLRPDIKRGNFTKEEEDTIFKLHHILGNRWSAIAARLPGRTDNEIKNFWNSRLKKKLNHQKPNPSASSLITNSTNKPHKYSSTGISMDTEGHKILTHQTCFSHVIMSTQVVVSHAEEATSTIKEKSHDDNDHDHAPTSCCFTTTTTSSTTTDHDGKLVFLPTKSTPTHHLMDSKLHDQTNLLHYSSNSAFLMDHNKIINEDVDFWYNLFVKAEEEPSRLHGNYSQSLKTS